MQCPSPGEGAMETGSKRRNWTGQSSGLPVCLPSPKPARLSSMLRAARGVAISEGAPGQGATSNGGMVDLSASGRLHELDGLNPTRALILHAYYGLRRIYAPTQIGTREIAAWIACYEPDESQPSDALIRLTLAHAEVPHRLPGRPRRDSAAPVPVSPLLLQSQPLLLAPEPR